MAACAEGPLKGTKTHQDKDFYSSWQPELEVCDEPTVPPGSPQNPAKEKPKETENLVSFLSFVAFWVSVCFNYLVLLHSSHNACSLLLQTWALVLPSVTPGPYSNLQSPCNPASHPGRLGLFSTLFIIFQSLCNTLTSHGCSLSAPRAMAKPARVGVSVP